MGCACSTPAAQPAGAKPSPAAVPAQRPRSDTPEASAKGEPKKETAALEGAMIEVEGLAPGAEQTKARVLSDYFLGPYHLGHLFESEEYERFFDREVGKIMVLEHRRTGIRAWNFALDLREDDEGGEDVVLYHYTNSLGLANICAEAHHASELKASLEDPCAHFGKGIYAASREPGSFKSQEEVLINNYWPRCGDNDAEENNEANELKRGGGAGSGPDDPRNKQVVQAILQNPRRKNNAQYCVPILIKSHRRFDIWRQLPPDLSEKGIPPGHNRWEEPQWPGRDIHVVSTTSELLGASAERVLRVSEAQAQHSERTLGTEHPDTLIALGNWAASLSALGRDPEAEPLKRQSYEASCRTLGTEHPDTLIALGNWAASLSALDRDPEAEPLCKQCYEASCRTLGKEHPDTVRALKNWATIRGNVGLPPPSN